VETPDRPRYAPKLPLALIARLYRSDASGVRDDALLEDVRWRLPARCRDVLMVSAGLVRCPARCCACSTRWRRSGG
jgi:hypothetical protein